MSTTPLSVAILAAGKGTRMYSDLPKVLHRLAGKPLIQHVIDTAQQLAADKIHLVYGHGKEALQAQLVNQPLNWVCQPQQLGTGHALEQVLPFLTDDETVLILYGDTPLISVGTLKKLLQSKPKVGIALLTVEIDNPDGYGRVVRQQGEVIGIIEHKDANPDQRQIKEVNTGVIAANAQDLKRWLCQITDHNAQGEYYLTDIIGLAHREGHKITAIQPDKAIEVEGVNNRYQLALLERSYQLQQAEKLLLAGVTLQDPARFDLRGELLHGRDVTIDSNVIIEGRVTLGHRVRIDSGCILKNCLIGDDCVISPYTVMEGAVLAAGCTVGPFARLRPGAELAEEAHVGNFVEMKKAQLGKGSKAGHLSYLGDALIGANVNIGAGTITCNYDGANKHQTRIEDDVFIGSDTQLIAPINVARGATIAAGTTVTRDIAADELVLSRVKQTHIQGWKRPVKNHDN